VAILPALLRWKSTPGPPDSLVFFQTCGLLRPPGFQVVYHGISHPSNSLGAVAMSRVDIVEDHFSTRVSIIEYVNGGGRACGVQKAHGKGSFGLGKAYKVDKIEITRHFHGAGVEETILIVDELWPA